MAKKAKARAPGPGRPRLAENGHGPSRVVAVRVSDQMSKRLDAYRKAQNPKLATSDALRRLAEQGLVTAGY